VDGVTTSTPVEEPIPNTCSISLRHAAPSDLAAHRLAPILRRDVETPWACPSRRSLKIT
jgi:hypothetical protein